MTTPSRPSYLVPTIGRSPHLRQCLEALLASEARTIVLAVPRSIDLINHRLPREAEILRIPDGAGFTDACNLSLAATEGRFVALVNDDAIVGAGWSEALLSALEQDSDLAAAQGVNLQMDRPEIVDGCGIKWNRAWQAVQVGHGQPYLTDSAPGELFGVSCTAAMFRRSALEAVAQNGDQIFDTRLGTYYEDVELACRLRSRGMAARCVPTVSAQHAGATSSSGNPRWRWGQIYGNRLLVLARLLGRSFLPRLPLFLGRDLLDLSQASLRLDTAHALGIIRGWLRALRFIPAYARVTSSMVPMAELKRLQETDYP